MGTSYFASFHLDVFAHNGGGIRQSDIDLCGAVVKTYGFSSSEVSYSSPYLLFHDVGNFDWSKMAKDITERIPKGCIFSVAWVDDSGKSGVEYYVTGEGASYSARMQVPKFDIKLYRNFKKTQDAKLSAQDAIRKSALAKMSKLTPEELKSVGITSLTTLKD